MRMDGADRQISGQMNECIGEIVGREVEDPVPVIVLEL